MANERKIIVGDQLATRLLAAGIALVSAAMLLVVLAAAAPIGITDGPTTAKEGEGVEPLVTPRYELDPLLAKLAGRILIRPAQVQAAVKNDGTAERLLKKLKLQGVVQAGNELVAYIEVEDGAKTVRTVRKGQTVLDFVVEEVETGKVTLSLHGVVVILGHG